MKHILTLTLLIAFAHFGFSQDACSKHEKMKTIPATIDNSAAKFAKTYWAKRCACETGNITGGTWDYTVEIMNNMYEIYQKPGALDGYKGPSFPIPDKRMSVSDCKSSSTMVEYSVTSTNCNEPAFTKEKDPQQYGNDFMMARCQCLEGVPYQEQAKQLELKMEVNYNNAKTYYGNSWVTQNLPQVMKWEECPLIRLGQDPTQDPNIQKPAPALVYTGRESDLDKLKDQYLETFSTRESFSSYVSGENIKRIGVTMAKDFADNLKSLTTLIETTDPLAMHQDYMQKINSIETLEARFNAESNTYFFESGQQLGGSIVNKDYETAMFQAGGILNAHLERKEAEKELEERKKVMKSELQKKLYKIYKKTKDFNEVNRKKYLKFSAFSEDETKEVYYLGLVGNLDCFDKNLWSGVYNVDGSQMVNNCPVPKLTESNTLENKFITEDVRLSKIAENKYNTFLETGYTEFRDAAITFASAACNAKPLAKYFDQAGKYCDNHSSVLQLNNYLSALTIDPNFYSKDGHKSIDSLRIIVQNDVLVALENNNLEFIQTFIETGLDKTIHFDDQSLLMYTISIDQPLALQSILNNYVDDKNTAETQKYLQKMIMLCAANNAGNCIQKFVELGVNVDFVLNKEHTIEVAEKNLSPNAYKVLLKNSQKKTQFVEKFKDSPIHILITAINDPETASKQLEGLVSSDDFSRVIDGLITNLPKTDSYFQTLGSSEVTLNYIYQEPALSAKIHKQIRKKLFVPFYTSNVHLYFEHKLVASSKVPTLGDIGFTEGFEWSEYNHMASYKKDLHTYYDGSSANERAYESTFNTYRFTPIDNLAWIAYIVHNPSLFGALDKTYDLSEEKGENGKSLFESFLTKGSFTNIQDFSVGLTMFNTNPPINEGINGSIANLYKQNPVFMVNNYVKQDYDAEIQFFDFEIEEIRKLETESIIMAWNLTPNRKAFYSSDFDFTKPIGGKNPLFLYLESAINWSINNYQSNRFLIEELADILLTYQIDPSARDNDGNTLLHWIAEYTPHIKYIFGVHRDVFNAELINSLNIDKSIKNNDGLSAYKLWKLNPGFHAEYFYKQILK